VAALIEQRYPGVEVEGNTTRPRVGAFEVTYDGKVLWSKLSGQGFPTSDQVVAFCKNANLS